MKRIKLLHFSLVILLAVSFLSGSLVLYSHYCSSEQVEIESVVKIEHCSSEQMAVTEKQACHKMETEQPSCHKPKSDQKPCCQDKAEFKSNNQVTQSIVTYQFFPIIFEFNRVEIKENLSEEFVAEINPEIPPPLLSTDFPSRYQQFLL